MLCFCARDWLTDEDEWPPEARFLVAAYYGNVRRLKGT
jgi:hypothetical protein